MRYKDTPAKPDYDFIYKIYYDDGSHRVVYNGTDLWIWANIGSQINLIKEETDEETFLGVMTRKGLNDHIDLYYVNKGEAVEDYFISGRWMFDLR